MASYNQMPQETLRERAEAALDSLESCDICPRACGVNRLAGEVGYCRSGRLARVSSFTPHFGEEAPLVGTRGSGTIFMTGCNLRCVFCQNYDISHLGEGREVSPAKLAEMMICLQEGGCHNINFVTPTHFVPQILEALCEAAAMGLLVPLVYNSGGYDSVETLRLLDGIFDIYMPDAKYGTDSAAKKYSDAPDYTRIMKAAIREMHRQVGPLEVDDDGVAIQGLLVRHLVLPENLAGTAEVVRFLAEEVSPETYLNVMAQYHPCYKAYSYPELSRPITLREYAEAVGLARAAGLDRGIGI
ncbi:radical SAM protein [Methanotrichaceae archaeon M04Ac]|uniref:Radical SAM protein n=1 Tax=Candidatus Methanocrinis alkalitolerans TaxID=3033395 RepID=A0ABT5XCJ0_9EURY|nr:radical SAM protein [Candidatus Methanocrinis alkalitolerans]MDF0592363.1 radical SAM protein [Candidatus Methanocrinis alkalitolerans]